MIAFADSDNSPVILLNRNDIEDDDKSAKRFCNWYGSEKWKMGDSRINETSLIVCSL